MVRGDLCGLCRVQSSAVVTLTFVVYAVPMPKGSKTQLPNGMMIDAAPPRSKDPEKRKEQRRRMVEWPLDVQGAAFVASTTIANRRTELVNGVHRLLPVFDGPVNVCAQFFFPRPKNETRAQRLRVFCTRKPDLDKLLRGVLDPMKKAGIYRDDSQVCGFAGSEKRYVPFREFGLPTLADNMGLTNTRPRVEITVTALQETLP
jgi:Holliday junction resolvase RusA-like endonuclease